MDFTTTEAAHDLGGLVDTIVDSVCTPERQRELDGLEQRFDRDLWRKLIEADILTSASASARVTARIEASCKVSESRATRRCTGSARSTPSPLGP